MVQALRRAGYRTVALDDLSQGHAAAVQDGDLVQESLADRGVLRALLRRHRPSAICHFAAHARPDESMEYPLRYYRNNVEGTLNLLEAAVEAGVPRFILSSTCAVYGEPKDLPVTEDSPIQPVSVYGRTKRMGELMLEDAARAYGIGTMIFRYFNVAGAETGARLGEDHRPETHLIPLALRAAHFQEATLQIHGDDYPTPDGTCIRDYVHVLDLIDAHLRGLKHLEEGGENCILNLGTGTGYSVRQILETVEQVTGASVPHEIGPRRPGDPAHLTASYDRAKQVLQWEPKRDLDEMIRTAYRFLRARPEGYPEVVEPFGGYPEPHPAEID
jgi:UDP-glucose-4-epimerase GalE